MSYPSPSISRPLWNGVDLYVVDCLVVLMSSAIHFIDVHNMFQVNN